MKIAILAPLLLSSTAFAGMGRWSRRQETLCRPGTASDCPVDQVCQYVTRNPDGSGFDGACKALTVSSSSAAPAPSIVICRDDSNCASGQRCQFVTRNPDGSGFDGACVAATAPSSSSSSPSATSNPSSSASSPAPSQSGGGCRVSTDCIATQYCNYNTGGAQKCTNYPDCRFNGCPGGQCVSEKPNVFDPRDIDNAFICDFSSSSSAPSSSFASASSTSMSSLASSTPVVSATKTAEPTSSVHPTATDPSDSDDCDDEPETSPAPTSAPVFVPGPDAHPAPSSDTPHPAPASSLAPASAPVPSPDGCTVDYDQVLHLLYDIKQEVKAIKQDIEEIKVKWEL